MPSLKTAYKDLVRGSIDVFYVYPGGFVNYPDCFWTNNVNLYPGSWNPLHDGHKAIFESIQVKEGERDWKSYELSLKRKGKEFLNYEELEKRVNQFKGYAPLVVTDALTFAEKAGIFRGIGVIFHIGMDTASRLLEDQKRLGVEGINATFRVYDRPNSKIEDRWPRNFLKGELKDYSSNHLSSTMIRELNN